MAVVKGMQFLSGPSPSVLSSAAPVSKSLLDRSLHGTYEHIRMFIIVNLVSW